MGNESIASIYSDHANWKDRSIDREAPHIGRLYYRSFVNNVDYQPCKSTWDRHRADPPTIERTALFWCGDRQGEGLG